MEAKQPVAPQESKRIIPKVAYQMEEKNGGFQLVKIEFSDDYKDFIRYEFDSPDAWNQVIDLLENELSKQFV